MSECHEFFKTIREIRPFALFALRMGVFLLLAINPGLFALDDGFELLLDLFR